MYFNLSKSNRSHLVSKEEIKLILSRPSDTADTLVLIFCEEDSVNPLAVNRIEKKKMLPKR